MVFCGCVRDDGHVMVRLLRRQRDFLVVIWHVVSHGLMLGKGVMLVTSIRVMVLVAAGDVTLVILAFCLNGLPRADFNGLLMVLRVRNMNLGEG